MKNFYEGGHSMPKISPHVETQDVASPMIQRRHKWTSLRRRKRRSKPTSAVQRGEVGIPRSVQMYLHMWLYAIRRGETSFAQTSFAQSLRTNNHLWAKYFLPLPILLCFLCLFAQALAQSRQDIGTADGRGEIRPLQIGDAIPEALWRMPLQVVHHPEGRDTITLHDYRDKKLIILDFWATWCAPCIRSLHKLDSIQPLFAQDLQVIPITQQDKATVAPFLKKQQWRHFSTYGPSDLSGYFPHGTIPHQVWIKDNRIMALTGSAYTEARFIRDVLRGGNPFTFMKAEDLSFDPKVPLFARMPDGTSAWQGSIGTFSILTMHQPDLPFAREWWDGSSWMMTNMTIPALYARAFADVIPLLHYDRRLIVEVADSLKEQVVLPRQAPKYERKVWLAAHTYCYHAGMAVPVDQSIYRKRLRSELNSYFGNRYGIQGALEKRKIDLLELSIADMDVFQANSRERSKGDMYCPTAVEGDKLRFRNVDAQSLISRMTHINSRSDIPMINTVASKRIFAVDIQHGNDLLSGLEAWNAGLAKVGLKLVRKMDYLDMLVIRSSNTQ